MNQKKIVTVIAIVVISLVFLMVLTGAVLIGTGVMTWSGGLNFKFAPLNGSGEKEPSSETSPEEPAAGPETEEPTASEPTAAPPTVNGVSYSATPEEMTQGADQVVAKVGALELTNGELQIHYWMSVYQDMYYLYYYYGVDFNTPLDQQVYNAETGQSWQEAFLEHSLKIWKQMAAIRLYAEMNGFTLDEEGLAYLENLDSQIQKEVEEGGYASAEAMLLSLFGAGVTVEDYKSYLTTEHVANKYMEWLEAQHTPNMEQIEAYFAENEASLATNNITKDMGSLMDVRHILVIPKGGTTEGNTTVYSEAEWEACRVLANQILDGWKAGEATEESFAEMAKLHSEDPGSKEKGGLYTDVYEGQMVAEFEEWTFHESRKYGDTGIVKTSYGYHIMYFVRNNPIWINAVREIILNERLNAIVDKAVELAPSETDHERILLGEPGNIAG